MGEESADRGRSDRRLAARVAGNIRRRLIEGLLVVIPMAITVWVLLKLYELLDQTMQPVVKALFGRQIPGVGLVATLLLLYCLGAVAGNIVGQRLLDLFNRIMGRVPLAREVYNATRQLIDSARLSKGSGFNRVVLVEFPHERARSLGFVTATLENPEGGEPLLNVYVPTAPNPTSGFTVLVESSRVTDVAMSSDDAIKLIVSAGLLTPRDLLTARVGKPGAAEGPAAAKATE